MRACEPHPCVLGGSRRIQCGEARCMGIFNFKNCCSNVFIDINRHVATVPKNNNGFADVSMPVATVLHNNNGGMSDATVIAL
jgi:hypothetical protein